MNVSLLNSIKNNERIEHEYVTNRVYSFDTDFIYSFTFHQLFEEAKKIETIVEFARFIIRNMLLLYQIDHFILSLTSTKDKAYTYILGDVAKIKESIISAIKLDIPITTDNSSCVIDDDIISQLIVKQMKTKEAYEDWQLSLQ